MIQKKIHYVWFGPSRYDLTVKKCIKSWRKYLPDYEFKLWNESNSPMDREFLREAYLRKSWAFCSDYVRLYALYHEGGVYLDTDMLLIKGFDELLSCDFFIGKSDSDIIAGGIIGTNKHNEYIFKCLEYLDNSVFDEEFHKENTIPKILTTVYLKYFQSNQTYKIFDIDYFYPLSFDDSLRKINPLSTVTSNTIAIHLWSASWFPPEFKGILAAKNRRIWTAIYYFIKAFLKNPRVVYLKNINYAVSKFFSK